MALTWTYLEAQSKRKKLKWDHFVLNVKSKPLPVYFNLVRSIVDRYKVSASR